MSLPDKWEELPLLERARLLEEASRRHAEAIRARQEDNRATLEETMIRLDAITNAPPLDPRDLETSVEHVRRWSRRDMHPPWFQAVYADLAQRMEILYAEVTAMRTQLDAITRLLRPDDHGRDA